MNASHLMQSSYVAKFQLHESIRENYLPSDFRRSHYHVT